MAKEYKTTTTTNLYSTKLYIQLFYNTSLEYIILNDWNDLLKHNFNINNMIQTILYNNILSTNYDQDLEIIKLQYQSFQFIFKNYPNQFNFDQYNQSIQSLFNNNNICNIYMTVWIIGIYFYFTRILPFQLVCERLIQPLIELFSFGHLVHESLINQLVSNSRFDLARGWLTNSIYVPKFKPNLETTITLMSLGHFDLVDILFQYKSNYDFIFSNLDTIIKIQYLKMMINWNLMVNAAVNDKRKSIISHLYWYFLENQNDKFKDQEMETYFTINIDKMVKEFDFPFLEKLMDLGLPLVVEDVETWRLVGLHGSVEWVEKILFKYTAPTFRQYPYLSTTRLAAENNLNTENRLAILHFIDHLDK
ncbi:hypothetical protein DFA_08257 [Cavenderia fasciculata]|uniref:Uncharacterized protein n=1 Tax=Cavenderia fasciculata TaxID=261658 RepID=F4Q5K7_CACFS|nr:uncharacterized protein DFA_08257 [Cavenderia fasciculata]EGG17266.1 hypothetical protein DFA_08257 [Cavenderia fasciculata]|eukprot:XP_004355750.1 hypothetical protein DFA_08257 [Cavenderia fasciculata]